WRRSIRHLQCRYRARAEVALRVAGYAAAAVTVAGHDHIGADIAHQASVRIAGAHPCVHRRDKCVPMLIGGMDAVAQTEVEVEAVLKVVVSVKRKAVIAALAS